MIPLKLTVKNFLCYSEGVPTLDLEGISLACLCGENGHGKSALLDAITWALWGRARGKVQDDLVHYGHDEMLVEVEFLARETRYRAVRRHAIPVGRRRQSPTDLQLQVDTGGDFHAITGNSMRETQAKIDQVTGMDYDTFINSAYLVQGRADEFTNKTSGERKEVLGKVLGLGRYDRLQDMAKEEANGRRDEVLKVEAELDGMRHGVSPREDYRRELDGVNQELGEVSGRLQDAKQALNDLKMRVNDIRKRRGEVEEIQARIGVIGNEILAIQKEIDDREGRTAGYRALIQEKVGIEEGLAQFRKLRRRYEELNRSRELYDHLLGSKFDLEKTVDSARATLEEQVKQLERRLTSELRPRVEGAPTIGGKLEGFRMRLDELAREERDASEKRLYLHDLAGRVGRLEATAHQLKSEGQELRSKLNLVQSSHEGARCPLCDAELGAEGCQRLLDSYQTQIEEKLRLYKDNQGALEPVEKEKLGLELELPRIEAELRKSHGEGQLAVADLERQLAESRTTAEEMEQAEEDLGQWKRRMAQGLYATTEKQQLAELESKLSDLGYDQAVQQRLYHEMEELQAFKERHRRLDEAEVALPREEQSLALAQKMEQRRQGELLESKQSQQELEGLVSALPQWEERQREAELAYDGLAGLHGQLFRRQVELEAALKIVEALLLEIDRKEKRLKGLRNELSIYQDLAEAFGKRGVQALLIETVLPRIEEEANALLGRMTDNRMHVKLETQRERRTTKGEPIETLEIKISDELGPRSYELFSGGESFRINLALRIALSKVLARRRGAPLPTLFIDEGFGTQDTVGRERILDVIRAIEGDFEKIIVITHLDEVKDAFPVRIEVQKQETGSTFWIS